MSTYFVRMTPLEPFTFGGEKGFRFDSKDMENGRNNTANTTTAISTASAVNDSAPIIAIISPTVSIAEITRKTKFLQAIKSITKTGTKSKV